MMGLAWASCWPITLQAAGESHPAFFLLGAGCALLPDALDGWIAPFLAKPDIHIVTAPEDPDPGTLAEALAHLMVQAQRSGRTIDIVCHPIPTGPGHWIPCLLNLDSLHRIIRVTIDIPPPISAMAPSPVDFTTDHITRLRLQRDSLFLRLQPGKNKRLTLLVNPFKHQWSHSLILALGSGVLAAGFGGLSAGLIAAGAYAIPILSRQWGFRGCALFWPFKTNRCPAWQWVKPRQRASLDLMLLWLAFLLLAGNILHATTPAIEAPSRLQLLLAGLTIALALTTRFRLNRPIKQPLEGWGQEYE